MLSYTDLKKGIIFVLDGEPYEVLESSFMRMQQRKPVMQTRIKNLLSGKVISRNFQPSDEFEEAEIEKLPITFIFSKPKRGGGIEYWFCEENAPQNRFMLDDVKIGESAKFLKENISLTAIKFEGEIIAIKLPIKMDFKVIEAPPVIKGATAVGGTKQVRIEGGGIVVVPMFIETGDIIRVNTETGEYVERVAKGQ